MTVREIFDLRKQGRIEEAYDAIRARYAVYRGKYTTLCMFWTARDIFNMRMAAGRTEEARNLIEHDSELQLSAEVSGDGVKLSLLTHADRDLGLVSRLDDGGAISDAVQVTPVWADNGTYYKVTELLESETRANGGNLAIITKHKSPDAASSIHRIWADIYYLEDMSVLAVMDSLDRVATVHPDYAVIYLYRPEALAGFALSYNVSVNDTKVYHCSNNSSAEVKIYEPGEYTVWAKTESRSEVPLKVELGEEYYIECSVGMGAFVGRPVLRLIDSLPAE